MSSDLSPLFLYHLSITLDFYSLFGSLSNYFELFQISPCFFTHSFYVIVTLSLHLLISLSPYYSFILILCQTISWLFPLDHSLSLSFHHATSICLFFFHLSYVTLSLYYTPFLPLCHEDNNEEIVWIKPILHYENSIHLIYIYLIVTCNFVHTSLMRLFFPAPLILFTSLYFFYLIFISVSFFPDAIPFTRYSHSLLFSLVVILPSLPHILSFSLSYEMYLWFLSPNYLAVNISINESPSQKLLFLHYLFLTLFLCLLFIRQFATELSYCPYPFILPSPSHSFDMYFYEVASIMYLVIYCCLSLLLALSLHYSPIATSLQISLSFLALTIPLYHCITLSSVSYSFSHWQTSCISLFLSLSLHLSLSSYSTFCAISHFISISRFIYLFSLPVLRLTCIPSELSHPHFDYLFPFHSHSISILHSISIHLSINNIISYYLYNNSFMKLSLSLCIYVFISWSKPLI